MRASNKVFIQGLEDGIETTGRIKLAVKAAKGLHAGDIHGSLVWLTRTLFFPL
jgi:hypothetical protein